MALIIADRVKETTTTTGTGTLTLDGAILAFQTFNAAMATSDTCYYCIVDGTQWEVGIGTFTDPNQLARTTILASTNSNSAIVLATGTKEVFITLPASKIADIETGTWTPAIYGSTGAGTATYSTQLGYYTRIGKVLTFHASVVFTGHTGTGDMRMNGLSAFSPKTGVNQPLSLRVSDLTFTANAVPSAVIYSDSVIYFTVQANGAAVSVIAMDAAASVLITGSVILN